MIEHRKELILFLLTAKKKTYAAKSNEIEAVIPGSKEHGFDEGEFSYVDRYFGGTRFSGNELVRYSGTPFWAMNYFGRNLTDQLAPGFSDFLKDSLMHVPEFAPYRGPRYYRAGSFDYSCTWTGDLDMFQGKETISAGGTQLYELYFHGGTIIA